LYSQRDEIARYLRTGKRDTLRIDWPGDSFVARERNGNDALRNALIMEVIRRAPHPDMPEQLANVNIAALAREKIAPMVCGLFPVAERTAVMDMFSRAIVFLTPDNIASVLLETPFITTAWELANLYLLSCSVEPLSKEAPEIVGLSEGTTCYVSAAYFRFENRFEDFVVHEAAHVFHNCKRETVGLPKIRGRERLLEIEFRKRELFAYACETYSRVVALGATGISQKALLEEIESRWTPPDHRVDVGDYLAALHDAVSARSGWRRILKRCASRPSRRAE
jgi:hypothetical protein